jgi:monoamine oxidase
MHPKAGVKVYCSDGYVAEGDKIICTAPTFAVAQIKWEPGLPPALHTALHGLQYARINKNAILYSHRFWERENFDMITDMPGHYFYHATKNQTGRRRGGALISYTIGDKAAVIASQRNDERINLADQSLKTAFPYTGVLAMDQLNYYWGNDKMSMGAYAVYGKGQWFDLLPTLRKHFLHTHFAGEHLSENWGGFMEGALETGRDAALAIMG